MSEHEVYPSAPVVLVALEARHPDAAPLTPGEQSEIKRLLASTFPLPQPAQNRTITQTNGGPPTVIDEVIPRFATRDQTTAVTYGTQAIAIESTRHQSFEHLSGLVRLVVETRQSVAPVEGLLRLGLRYINEIRVPDAHDDPARWGQWVAPGLMGPVPEATELGLMAEQWQGVTVFDRGDGRQVLLRYGPREGFAVGPGGPLQRATPPPGDFFLLDIDSFWMPTGDVPEFLPDVIETLCLDLHEPVSGLFEALITERLRTEVLRHV